MLENCLKFWKYGLKKEGALVMYFHLEMLTGSFETSCELCKLHSFVLHADATSAVFPFLLMSLLKLYVSVLQFDAIMKKLHICTLLYCLFLL